MDGIITEVNWKIFRQTAYKKAYVEMACAL